jgi:ABC-type branched-subunit amino acid transport system ATPase component
LSQSERAVVLQKGQVVLSGQSSELLSSSQLSQYLGV